jgi:hypothetical protein
VGHWPPSFADRMTGSFACLAGERSRELPGLGILALRSGGSEMTAGAASSTCLKWQSEDSSRRWLARLAVMTMSIAMLKILSTRAGICPVVALDERHPAVWRNGGCLGVLELRPRNRQLHEFQKHILVVLNGSQPSVVPFGGSLEGAPSATSHVADRNRSQMLVRPRDRCRAVRAKTVPRFMSIVSRTTRVIDRRNGLVCCRNRGPTGAQRVPVLVGFDDWHVGLLTRGTGGHLRLPWYDRRRIRREQTRRITAGLARLSCRSQATSRHFGSADVAHGRLPAR